MIGRNLSSLHQNPPAGRARWQTEMIKLLTLSEMAARYGLSPKTFAKHVREARVPHELVGRHMRFDPAAVSAHFAARVPDPAKVVKFRPAVRKNRTTQKSKFAERVGL